MIGGSTPPLGFSRSGVGEGIQACKTVFAADKDSPAFILCVAHVGLHVRTGGSMEAVALDRPRVSGEEPGFSLRGREFRFLPNGNPDKYAAIFSAETDSETLVALDVFVEDVLPNIAAIDSWRDLRAAADPPLWFDELFAVARHIGSVTAQRPTMPSNGSSPGATKNGTGSTADSSSPEVVPSPV